MNKSRTLFAAACLLLAQGVQAAPLPSPQFQGVQAGPRGSILVAHQAFGWRISLDGGNHWREIQYPYSAWQIDANFKSYRTKLLDQGGIAAEVWPQPSLGRSGSRRPLLYSCVSEHIYEYSTSGTSWELISTLPGQYCIGLEHIGSAVIVATSSGLFRSTNRGRSWTRLQEKNGLTGDSIEGLLADSQGRLFSIIRKGVGEAALIVSRDQGMSWRRVALPAKARKAEMGAKLIASVGKRLFVSSKSGLQYSEDAGNTWHPFDQGLDYHAEAWQNSDWERIRQLAGTPDGRLFAVSGAALYRRAASDRRWQRISLNSDGALPQ